MVIHSRLTEIHYNLDLLIAIIFFTGLLVVYSVRSNEDNYFQETIHAGENKDSG